MTVKEIEQKASYLFYCKQNYFAEIRPLDFEKSAEQGYKILVEITKTYVKEGQVDSFAQYMMEGQYFVQLWTAHLILEYGNPSAELSNQCLEEITKYSKSQLSPDVAKQEKEWLSKYHT